MLKHPIDNYPLAKWLKARKLFTVMKRDALRTFIQCHLPRKMKSPQEQSQFLLSPISLIRKKPHCMESPWAIESGKA
jgi:hypothetical protein